MLSIAATWLSAAAIACTRPTPSLSRDLKPASAAKSSRRGEWSKLLGFSAI